MSDREEQHNRAKEEMFKKFSSSFIEKINDDPLRHNVIYSLIYGADPYDMIEQLVNMNINTNDQMKILLVNKAPYDKILIVNDKNWIDEFTKNK